MWKNANNNAIRTKIRELTTNIIEMVRKGTTVNEWWIIFKETLYTIISSNVPTKLSRSRHSNPWMNTTLKRMIRRRQRAYNKARSSQHHKDWDCYKPMQTATQRELRNANDKYIYDILLGDIHNEPEILVIPEREVTGFARGSTIKEDRRIPTQRRTNKGRNTEPAISFSVHQRRHFQYTRHG
jgi:hypothetical protein